MFDIPNRYGIGIGRNEFHTGTRYPDAAEWHAPQTRILAATPSFRHKTQSGPPSNDPNVTRRHIFWSIATEKQKSRGTLLNSGFEKFKCGDVLLSHTLPSAVPSPC